MELRTRDDVDAVLELFPSTTTMADGMVDLMVNLHLRDVADDHTQATVRAVRRVLGSFGSLLVTLERHDWQKRQAASGTLNHTSWMSFAGCDVEYFYVVLRSLFDDLVLLCGKLAIIEGQCPSDWSLYSWCQDVNRADRILGHELATAIRACTWFESVRGTRDGIVHFGAWTLAIPSVDTVSFSVMNGARSSRVPAEIMTNENLGDFELFMAWAIGNLSITLDRVGQAGLRRFEITSPARGTSGRDAFGIVRAYLLRLRDRLPAAPLGT